LTRAAPDANIRCRTGFHLPGPTDFFEGRGRFDVLNFSWGDTQNSPVYLPEYDDFIYDFDIPIFVAAGNSGDRAAHVIGTPANSFNVLTVGNHDDFYNVWEFSEYEHPMRNIGISFGTTTQGSNRKPEVTANGVGIEFPGVDFSQFSRDLNGTSGTSWSTPVATGLYALYAGAFPGQLTAALAKSLMISGAKFSTSDNGATGRGGEGGIRFNSSDFQFNPPLPNSPAFHEAWLRGPNGFDELAGSDGIIQRGMFIEQGSQVRVTLVWLNRGTYAVENLFDEVGGLGRRLDFRVLDPNNNVVTESSYLRSGYQSEDFTASISGNYVVEITQGFLNDESQDFKGALSINATVGSPAQLTFVTPQGGSGQIVQAETLICIDTDGDGWGWNGVESCIIEEVGPGLGNPSSGGVATDCIDTDGDGWGWNGFESCIPSSTPSQCIDTDGDGWGWDGSQSCLIGTIQAGACIDSDGDGYGWNGVATCTP